MEKKHENQQKQKTKRNRGNRRTIAERLAKTVMFTKKHCFCYSHRDQGSNVQGGFKQSLTAPSPPRTAKIWKIKKKVPIRGIAQLAKRRRKLVNNGVGNTKYPLFDHVEHRRPLHTLPLSKTRGQKARGHLHLVTALAVEHASKPHHLVVSCMCDGVAGRRLATYSHTHGSCRLLRLNRPSCGTSPDRRPLAGDAAYESLLKVRIRESRCIRSSFTVHVLGFGVKKEVLVRLFCGNQLKDELPHPPVNPLRISAHQVEAALLLTSVSSYEYEISGAVVSVVVTHYLTHYLHCIMVMPL